MRFGVLLLLMIASEGSRAEGGLSEALDSGPLIWTNGGDTAWKPVQETAARAGGNVAEIKFVTNSADPAFSLPVAPVTSWLETEVDGPGVFTIWIRQNHNPRTSVTLLVDGAPVERAFIQVSYYQRGIFSKWHPLTAPISAGRHVVRVEYLLDATWDSAGYLYNPTVQLDQAGMLPPLPWPPWEPLLAKFGWQEGKGLLK